MSLTRSMPKQATGVSALRPAIRHPTAPRCETRNPNPPTPNPLAFQAGPSGLLELVVGCLGYAKTILINEFGPGCDLRPRRLPCSLVGGVPLQRLDVRHPTAPRCAHLCRASPQCVSIYLDPKVCPFITSRCAHLFSRNLPPPRHPPPHRPKERNPKPETRSPKPETRNPEARTRNLKPETRNPEPGTPNPETRNPKPGTRNPKPEPKPRNPKPETRNPGFGALLRSPKLRNL